MMNTNFKRLLMAAVFSASAAVMPAQSSTQGAIAGTVEDTTSAAIPAASVTIHNDGTNAEQHLTADASGFFKAPLLEPGTYTVTVKAPAFQTYVANNVTVQLGQMTSVIPHLLVGEASTVVQVSEEAPVLNFESPTYTATLNTRALENIPVNNLRWSSLALATPGVVSDSNGFGLVSIRGISPILNNVLIDGADDNQAYYSEERGRTREAYSTPPAAIREFSVNTGVYERGVWARCWRSDQLGDQERRESDSWSGLLRRPREQVGSIQRLHHQHDGSDVGRSDGLYDGSIQADRLSPDLGLYCWRSDHKGQAVLGIYVRPAPPRFPRNGEGQLSVGILYAAGCDAGEHYWSADVRSGDRISLGQFDVKQELHDR